MITPKRTTALALGAILVIAGCAPGTAVRTATPAPSATTAPAATATAATSGSPSASEAAASEGPGFDTTTPITILEWDTESQAGPSGEMDALNAAFMAKYPNVTIKRTSKNFDDYVATIKLAASGPDAPDVFQGNEGYSVDAALVKAKLIVPLDDYAAKYGWEARFGSPSTLDVLRWSEDGTQWTKGPLWGIAQKAEVLGVFYNKDMLAKLNLAVPTTFDEFQASLGAAKAAGDEGILVGGLDGWPLGHIFMMLQSLYGDAQAITDWTFAVPGATFDTDASRQAAQVMQDWATNGYFAKGFAGLTQDNAAARFAKGESLYFLTGPWENATFAPMADNVGWFPLPPTTAGTDSHTTGALSIPYHISSGSQHADVAAAWIDFITSPDAANVVAKAGDLPAAPLSDPSSIDPNSSLAAIIAGFEEKSGNGLLTPYLDWATDTMGDTLFGNLQRVTASKMTPADFAKDVQADWSKAHSGS